MLIKSSRFESLVLLIEMNFYEQSIYCFKVAFFIWYNENFYIIKIYTHCFIITNLYATQTLCSWYTENIFQILNL